VRVLVACERSGIVREAFKARGHDAWSCDLEPTDIPGNHYQGDVRDYLTLKWDLMIAHPPCTYLSSASGKILYDVSRLPNTIKAFKFVKDLYNAPILKKCIENPVGWLNKNWKPASQIIHPYYFGDNQLKRTCLWLTNLPRLNGLLNVAIDPIGSKPIPVGFYNGKYKKAKYFIMLNRSAEVRSQTFQGIANAMADQWG